jgi:thiamine pyrophosphokinase
MAPVTGQSSGLRWPLDGISFAPWARIATSNEVTGPVALAFDGPGMLVITPREVLAQVSAALTG